MENRISPFLISALCIGIALLYIPIFVLIGYSFNASALVSVWGGFSTNWYTQLVHNDQILDAAWLSLKIGVVVSTGSVILGTLAAISLVRFQNLSRPAGAHGHGQGAAGDAGNHHRHHPAVAVHFDAAPVRLAASRLHDHRDCAYSVLQRLRDGHRSIAAAECRPFAGRSGHGLGESGPVRAFIDTTLPSIAPALASSWLLSFTLSLDDLVISSFVSGPGASTLPMVIFSKVKLGVSPDVNALASLVICLVGVCVLFAGHLMRRAERQRVLDAQMAEQR